MHKPGAEVFLSYRHEDSSASAQRLYERLTQRFGKTNIFLDSDALQPGHFREQIQKQLNHCRVLIVVIGPRWLEVKDKTGRRRIDDPSDFVRKEIGIALNRKDSKFTVIPLLVDDARLPLAEELPDELAPLLEHQMYEIISHRTDQFNHDVDHLNKVLEEGCGVPYPFKKKVRIVVCVFVLAAGIAFLGSIHTLSIFSSLGLRLIGYALFAFTMFAAGASVMPMVRGDRTIE